MSEQEKKVLYYCREWYRTGREVIKQTLWYEIGVMLENEPDAEQSLHLTGGDSAPSQSLSTPDMFSAIEHEPTPAPRR